MQICFFSDDIVSNLKPLTLTRPVDDLRIGILTIREKWQKSLGLDKSSRVCPNYMSDVFGRGTIDPSKDCIWINSQVLPNDKLIQTISSLDAGEGLKQNDTLLVLKLDGDSSYDCHTKNIFEPSDNSFSTYSDELSTVHFLWDLLNLNATEIEADISLLGSQPLSDKSQLDNVITVNNSNIYIASDAIVEPGSILNASSGSIFIGSGAVIESGSIIKGPVAICERATTKMACRIYDGTTVGPACKVGGEVANSIFHSFSNKGHDGFVGNSLIGQWCNFGADSNTSNLKNNYSLVRLPHWESKDLHGSGVQFFGTVMGDHSKTSINSMLNTGTMCGVSSNIFTSSFPPKFIPSFSWLSDNGVDDYIFDKALIAMKAMMKRRGVELSDDYALMMDHIFSEK